MAKGKGKSTKRNSFFSGNGFLKLDREIEKERDKSEGQKGFLKELGRKDKVRNEYKEAKKAGQEDSLFRGQDVAPQAKPEKANSSWMSSNPADPNSSVKKEEGRMSAIQNFRLGNKDIK